MHTEQAANATTILTKQETDMIAVLLYFDMFDHPLTKDELAECSKITASAQEPDVALKALLKQQLVYQFGAFYAIKNIERIAEKRIKGNALADIYLERARLVSRFISWFPFVRGVIISGSLSKHYMEKGSDIDFFIVTEKGRLWICRTMLAVFRKMMRGPLRKYFCINYFVSADALKIPDENLFTATELAFMYPLYGSDIYERMMAENEWIKEYYPNKKPRTHFIRNSKYSFGIKRAFEWIFKGPAGEKLDTTLFHFMLRRWKKRYGDEFDATQFDLNIRTKKNVSKQHEKGHQFLLLNKYKQQIDTFEQTHSVKLFHG